MTVRFGDRPGDKRMVEVIAERVRGTRPGEIPARLCDVAVELLPVIGASVSLRARGVPIRLSSTDDRAAQLAEIQTTLGDGPCQSAGASGTPVLASDLTSGLDARRWPVFAQEATAVGIRAVYALPLGTDRVCVGTLDLYRDTVGRLTPGELYTAGCVARAMTVSLTDLSRRARLGGLVADHDEINQATGMIMAQLGVGANEALARLRAHAFAQGRTVLAAARELVVRRRRLDRG
ncbi:ANTAR domain-containing protein [Streptomyces sp. ME02-8801-2C]|uniref:GAF and ANTAR domain-containing protein n=1 Tax=Streptomyces sp. ME02-8801-2C TaxID=3028680 RepID=UPI0029BBD087|nr:ANTAR domain-containing protein [Streptomyces sp. ME02-8801-2C]MDX3453994.1 ANTAR domain-containing protein [Streptomyces sp. ME02-8801-2C]